MKCRKGNVKIYLSNLRSPSVSNNFFLVLHHMDNPLDDPKYETQGRVVLYSRDNIHFKEKYVPRQLTPSPEYPYTQVQLYEPKVLLHIAFTSQLCF